jgi:phytoene/squalene synthetase
VAEDFRAGRVYLPQEDLERFGCTRVQLADVHAGGPLRMVLAFEVARARQLFAAGAPLIDELHGPPRYTVAAFLAGGRAAARAVERAGYDVLAGAPKASRGSLLVELAGTLLSRRGRAL